MLYYMNDDLIEEFKACPTIKDMWDKLRIKFSQTCAARLRTLHLK